MADKVSILDKDGVVTYYSTYGAARAAIISLSIEHPLIQIWATLTNEQIILLNGVDIWIAPGVTIDYLPPSLTTAAPTITDNGVECQCQIYGKGVIKNTFVGTTGNVYECIKITNVDTELEINCDYIEGVGGINPSSIQGICINALGNKFHLNCNKIYNQNNGALLLGSTANLINDINLNITTVVTGKQNDYSTGTSAILFYGKGFININEILCRNTGHCFSHRAGIVVAHIKKLTTINNQTGLNIACVHVPSTNQGTGTQELILYFDEINCLEGQVLSGTGIEATGGKSICIGRKIFSSTTYAISFGGSQTDGGYFKCDEIVSDSSIAINLGSFSEELNIYANEISGNYTDQGFSVVILSTGLSSYSSKFNINNARVINKNTSSASKGIYFENIYAQMSLRNVKIVSGNATNNIIYLSSGSFISVNNYGFFGNYDIDQEKIKLKIGIGTNPMDIGYNYQCIIDPLLT